MNPQLNSISMRYAKKACNHLLRLGARVMYITADTKYSASCILLIDIFDAALRAHFQEFAFLEREPEVEIFLALPATQETEGIAALKKLLPLAKTLTYHRSPYEAVNKAVQEAQGRYICLLKTGIALHEGALAAMCALLRKETQRSAGSARLRQMEARAATADAAIGTMPYDYADALYTGRECGSVLLWKKEVGSEPFNEAFTFLADEERVLRLAGNNRLLAFTGGIGTYSPG